MERALPESPFHLAGTTAVVLDVDGTIAGVAGVYPEAVELLSACTRLRVPVALCSARPTGSLVVLAGEHPCIGHVAGLQGSHVCRLRNGVTELVSATIDADVAAAVARLAEATGVELWWYAGIHIVFVASSVLLALSDRLSAGHVEPEGRKKAPPADGSASSH